MKNARIRYIDKRAGILSQNIMKNKAKANAKYQKQNGKIKTK